MERLRLIALVIALGIVAATLGWVVAGSNSKSAQQQAVEIKRGCRYLAMSLHHPEDAPPFVVELAREAHESVATELFFFAMIEFTNAVTRPGAGTYLSEGLERASIESWYATDAWCATHFPSTGG